jgi:hypothetical protein
MDLFAATAALFRAVAVLQSDVDVDVDLTGALGGGAVGTFVGTVVVGAILVALAPDYTKARMAEVVEEPVGNFVYGVVVLVFLILAVIVLVFTIVGIIVAIPLGFVVYLAWVFGSTIAFLAVDDRLVDRGDDEWLVVLLVAAGINGGLVLSGIGALVAFCVGAAGFGTVVRPYFD